MSKAKELAREVISQMEEIQRQVMNNNILSGFTNDWQSGFNHAMIELRNRLNDAVLSEPDEPEGLKGWIHIDDSLTRRLINFDADIQIIASKDTNLLTIDSIKHKTFDWDFDKLKQLIKEAS